MCTLGVWLFAPIAALLVSACGGSAVSDTSGGGGATGGTGGSGAASGGSGGTTSTCSPVNTACQQPSDCSLSRTNCCACAMPELADFVAVNAAGISQCACQGPKCECDPGFNASLGATCSQGNCAGFDVRKIDALSWCESDSECKLRIGLGCCEACSGGYAQMVAVRVDSWPTLVKLVCDAEPGTCDACLPSYPVQLKAACLVNHCAVVGTGV